MNETLRQATHPRGFSLDVPAQWSHQRDAAPGIPFVSIADDDFGTNFRDNIVCTIAPTGGLAFRDWQRGVDDLLARTLDGWLLLDLETYELDGCPAVRRLGHHVTDQGIAVTLDQWVVQQGDAGLTVTLTAATAGYDAIADLAASIGSSIRVTTLEPEVSST